MKKVSLSKIRELTSERQAPQLKIGLIPEQDLRKMAARYVPLANYLKKKLPVEVKLKYLDSYGETYDKFAHKELEAAFLGSFSYALTRAKIGIEPIARPNYWGVSTYRGLIIVRKNSGIRTVAGMKGKRLALVHQSTYAGYLYPLFYFRKHGVKELEKYFSIVEFVGSHDRAIFAVLKGEADVAAAKDLVYQRLARENPLPERDLEILAISAPVPANTLCVARDMKPDLKAKLRSALLNLKRDKNGKSVLEAMGASGFIKTEDKDYRYLYENVKALGIDLKTYPYYKRPDVGSP